MVMQRVTTFCVLLAFTATAFAQPEGGEGGRRRRGGEGRQGGGGRGGFGGGGPRTMGRGSMTPIQLAANEAVQKDLGVSAEEATKLKKLSEDYNNDARSAMAPLATSFADLQDLKPEERQAKMAEMSKKMKEIQKEMNTKFQPDLDKILDKPKQERLQQIAYQAMGGGIYEDAGVVAKLGITKEQQEKITAENKEMDNKRRELFAGGRDGGDFQERMTKMREMSEAHDKALEGILTAPQKEQLAQLKGKAFDVAALRQGRGGMGGGGGGPNPGGRPRRQGSEEKKADEKKSDEKPAEKK